MIPSRRPPTVRDCTIWHHERIGALVRALHYEDTKRVTKRQIWSFRPNTGLIALFPEITRPHDASRRVCPLDTATAQKDCFQSEASPCPNAEATPAVSRCRIPIRFRSDPARQSAALHPADRCSVSCPDVHPRNHFPAAVRRRRAASTRRHDPFCRVRARRADLARSSSLPGCGPRAGAMDVPNLDV